MDKLKEEMVRKFAVENTATESEVQFCLRNFDEISVSSSKQNETKTKIR